MNLEESLFSQVESDSEPEVEEKIKTVCAKFILTHEQPHRNSLTKMEEIALSISLTASEAKESKHKVGEVTEHKEVFAKFAFTNEQENDLREAFNLLDYKGEGKINTEDFRVAIKALGYEPTVEELQRMISAVDEAGSGKMSFENFETAIMRKIMSLDSDGDIMKSFRLFDMDDSGMINFENIKAVTHILGTHLSDEEIDEMLDDADKDCDGLISAQEFMKMIKTCVHIVTP